MAWSLAWHLHGIGDEDALKKSARGNARRLAVASRLVDAFLTSHPAFPCYVGCASMRRHRTRLLRVGIEEPAELHQALVKLRPWTAAEEREWEREEEREYGEEESEHAREYAREKEMENAADAPVNAPVAHSGKRASDDSRLGVASYPGRYARDRAGVVPRVPARGDVPSRAG